MGILKAGANATDNCCTVCFAGVGVAAIAVIGLPTVVALNVVASPVTVPIYLVRTSRYTKHIRTSIASLTDVQKAAVLKELGVDKEENVTWKVYSKHVKRLIKQANNDRDNRKYAIDLNERNTKTLVEQKAEHCPKLMDKNVVTQCKSWTYKDIHDANLTFATFLTDHV
jgi:hypothetical protein